MQVTNLNVLWSVGLMLVCSLVSLILGLRLERNFILGPIRALIQLSLLGLCLVWVIKQEQPFLTFGLILLMSVVATQTAIQRTRIKYKGIAFNSFFSILLSATVTAIYMFVFVLTPEPWYSASKVLPLMGMIFGNSLTGISLSLDKFTTDITQKRKMITTLLALGATRYEAAHQMIKDSIRTGLTPNLNALTVAGAVSIPGMMTGQILAGEDPLTAAKYQMIILFMITSCTFFSTIMVVYLSFFKFFNSKHQLIFSGLTQK